MPELCPECQAGNHLDCLGDDCECAHHCACGQHPTMCRCDVIYEERHEQ